MMKVLVCPLNWGLGHASRLVPIIKLLHKNNFEVIIAGSGDSLSFLQKEFSSARFIDFPNYKINYSRKESQVLHILFKLPIILFSSIKEHFQLRKIIQKTNTQIVISDNRFGLWSKTAYSIFITHQLHVLFPGKLKIFEPIYFSILKFIIKNYNECWIPDFQGKQSLSGKLSNLSEDINNIYYIGTISRFEEFEQNENIKKKYKLLFILSGPEPHRSILEKIIYEQTKGTDISCAIVRGTENIRKNDFSFPTFNLLNTKDLHKLINQSELIICRSGYSSVMDLITLNKRAILIPTPGQTEQEYLAFYLKEKGLFLSVKQSNLNIFEAIVNSFEPPGLKNYNSIELDARILSLTKIQKNKR